MNYTGQELLCINDNHKQYGVTEHEVYTIVGIGIHYDTYHAPSSEEDDVMWIVNDYGNPKYWTPKQVEVHFIPMDNFTKKEYFAYKMTGKLP